MDFIVISAAIFFMALLIIELSLYGVRNMKTYRRAKIKHRLKKYTFVETETGNIVKNRRLSDIDFLNRLLLSSSAVRSMDRLVLQANVKYPLGVYFLSSAFLGAFSFMITLILWDDVVISSVIALAFLLLPYLYLVNVKNRRARKFQTQLHEGLDLIARALRAGHSFTSSLQLAAEEFEDPLGTEFEETLDEINFGVSVPDALKSLMGRVDCKELNFFVMAVIIQRESGGNLADLISSLAHLLRERFRFQGNVRTLAAEGKMSALILILLPFVIGLFIFISSPEFMKPLLEEPIGHLMLWAAGLGMVIGSLIMRSMVTIDV